MLIQGVAQLQNTLCDPSQNSKAFQKREEKDRHKTTTARGDLAHFLGRRSRTAAEGQSRGQRWDPATLG